MIRVSVKRVVRSIYVMRCGYCQISEADVGSELTYDHFQPQSQGGSDDVDNIVYACHACNEFKGDYFGDTEETRLLHPLRDSLASHLLQKPDGTLEGITVIGQRYIDLLHLNRYPLVLHRLNKAKIDKIAQNYDNIDEILKQVLKSANEKNDELRS